jgi:hypothetical protein
VKVHTRISYVGISTQILHNNLTQLKRYHGTSSYPTSIKAPTMYPATPTMASQPSSMRPVRHSVAVAAAASPPPPSCRSVVGSPAPMKQLLLDGGLPTQSNPTSPYHRDDKRINLRPADAAAFQSSFYRVYSQRTPNCCPNCEAPPPFKK